MPALDHLQERPKAALRGLRSSQHWCARGIFTQRQLHATVVDAMPQARRLILDSAFAPDTVAMMGDAFDTAWGMIEPAFNGQPQSTIDDARTLLASNIVHQAKVGLSHPDILQEEAIRVVRQRYPSLRI